MFSCAFFSTTTVSASHSQLANGPQTGDEAVEFYGRTGEESEVKVLFLNRTPTGLNFRPYDLNVVDRTEIEPEHFTMSSSGVVHIQPGQPSQFTPLGQWWRRSSLFNTLRSIPFFKNYLPAKTYQLWNQNVRFRKYSQVRLKLIKKLFLAKRAFCSTLLELNRQCFELRCTPLLSYTTKHSYAIEEFIENQSKVRNESYKTFESIVDKIQALLEKVCEDVTSRVRASEDGLPPGGLEEAAATTSHKSQKSKSMQQMKQEALDRARALALARSEVAMLAQFIHLADYMVVESLLLLVMTQADSFFQDLHKPSKKSGLFTLTLSMERNQICFAPEKEDVKALISSMLEAMVSCVNNVPRLLYMAAFKPHFDDKQRITGPHLGDMIRTSSVYSMICAKIENVVETDFEATRDYAVFAEQYFPIYNYADEFNRESFANQDHIANSRSIKKEMLKLRQWGADLERMKLANVIGVFGVDSKTLRNFLIDRKSVVLEDMKSVLHTAARDSSADVLTQFQQRIKSLGRKPVNLKDFAAYVETKNVIGEDVKTLMQASATVDEMYKLLSSFDVKIPSSEQVKLDDLHMIHGQFQEAIDTAEQDVSAKIAQMAQALNQEIQKLDQELMEIMTDLASAECTNPKAESTAVLEMLDDVKAQIDRIQEKADQYSHYQKLFNMPSHEYSNLTSTRELFDEKFELWESLRSWEEVTSGPVGWRSQIFSNLRPEDMEKEVQASLKTAVRIFKKREDDVAARFKDDAIKWKGWMPTLIALGNPALRSRHWDIIFAKLGRPYDKDMTLDQLIQVRIFPPII